MLSDVEIRGERTVLETLDGRVSRGCARRRPRRELWILDGRGDIIGQRLGVKGLFGALDDVVFFLAGSGLLVRRGRNFI